MNDDRKEELLTRWMDDKLSGEELAELDPILSEYPELHEEREEYLRLQKELREAIPMEADPPYPDFFNSHLERQIRELDQAQEQAAPRRSVGALDRMKIWWMAPAGTAAVVMAFLLGMKSAQPDLENVMINATGSEVYSPLASVSTEVILDEDSEATLLVVEGLDPLSDNDLAIGQGFREGDHGYYVNTRGVY